MRAVAAGGIAKLPEILSRCGQHVVKGSKGRGAVRARRMENERDRPHPGMVLWTLGWQTMRGRQGQGGAYMWKVKRLTAPPERHTRET